MARASRVPSGESAGDPKCPVHVGSTEVTTPARVTQTSSETNPAPVPYRSAPDRSTLRFAEDEDPLKIGRELGADAVVEASLQVA
jgi:hypothetical protein